MVVNLDIPAETIVGRISDRYVFAFGMIAGVVLRRNIVRATNYFCALFSYSLHIFVIAGSTLLRDEYTPILTSHPKLREKMMSRESRLFRETTISPRVFARGCKLMMR
jgi:hypothetical protein